MKEFWIEYKSTNKEWKLIDGLTHITRDETEIIPTQYPFNSKIEANKIVKFLNKDKMVGGKFRLKTKERKTYAN